MEREHDEVEPEITELRDEAEPEEWRVRNEGLSLRSLRNSSSVD